MKIRNATWLFCLTVLSPVACGLSRDLSADARVTFEPADCPFQYSGGAKVDCGYLTVPEDRDRPDGRTIRLAFAVLHSSSKSPKADPLLYLSGGPGNPCLQWIEYLRASVASARKARDVVFLDQRGTGFSEPALDCPEFETAALETWGVELSEEEAAGARVISGLQACRERLVEEEVDLSAYHSAASAADVHDLMAALGYRRYNLYGISYGTRLAQTLMRDYPDEIRAVILDSVVPIEENMFETFAASNLRAFELFFERCASDHACNEAFPDLETVFYTLADELEKAPLPVTVGDATYQIGDSELFEVALYAMFDPGLIADLPQGIDALEEGQTSWMKRPLRMIISEPQSIWQGTHYSVWCREELPFNSAEAAAAVNVGIPPETLARMGAGELYNFIPACELWDVPAADPVETEAVLSEIPTLLLSGDYDPVTPPAFAGRMASHLETAHSFVFVGSSHGVLDSSACAREMMAEFLDAPDTSPDNSCMDKTVPTFTRR